jgi:hypothetical protein
MTCSNGQRREGDVAVVDESRVAHGHFGQRRAPEMRGLLAIVVSLVLLGQGRVAAAAGDSEGSTPQQATFGAGSFLGTLLYSPVKAGFCLLGGVAGGVTMIASRPTGTKIVGTSCRGTWVITPDVLKGKERVKFLGEVKP